MRGILLLLFSSLLFAQRGTTDARATAGYTTFIDDSSQHHLFTGGSVRHYLTNRFAVEPEFLFLYKDRSDRDLGFQINGVWNLTQPGRKAVPYLIAGAGLLHTRFRFPLGNGLTNQFTTNEWLVSGGGGVKVYLNQHWFLAPEARLGHETILRATVSVGYSWGR